MDTFSGFEIRAMSDQDYDDLIVEVLYNGELCFLVSQEQGFDKMRVAVHSKKDGTAWDFGMNELQAVLEDAAKRLWSLRKDT